MGVEAHGVRRAWYGDVREFGPERRADPQSLTLARPTDPFSVCGGRLSWLSTDEPHACCAASKAHRDAPGVAATLTKRTVGDADGLRFEQLVLGVCA
jgi:hypothetical protein